MNLNRNLALVAGIEAISMVATRLVIHYYPWNSVTAEVLRTGLRLGVACLIWWLLKPLIGSRSPNPEAIKQPALVLAIVGFLVIPVLTGNMGLRADLVYLFALTSLAVAIKEEFLFRGVIQNLLQGKCGFPKAVLFTSAVFTVWHIGLVPPTVWQFTEIFLAGIFLGVTYVRTGSMLVVVGLHAIYDAAYTFTPLLSPPYPVVVGFLVLSCVVALVSIRKDFLKSL